MWWYIVQGIGYGFAAAVQPGPLQTYLISQALMKGWRKSLPSAFAPLLSDGPIIALCLLVLSQVPAWLQRFLYVAGGLFVLYLAYGTYRSWKSFDPHLPAPETKPEQSLLNAALTNLLAPGAYLFWTLVTGPILIRGWHEAPSNGIGLLLGFYVTMILSLCGIIILFGAARQLGPRVNRALLGISAIALLGFGLYQLWLGTLPLNRTDFAIPLHVVSPPKVRIITFNIQWHGGEGARTRRNAVPETHSDRHPLDGRFKANLSAGRGDAYWARQKRQ